MFSFVPCTEKFVFLFVALARVKCEKVQCNLFQWSAIDSITLNGEVQNSLFPETESIYNVTTAVRQGINRLVVHTKSVQPEHMQVLSLDYVGLNCCVKKSSSL